jgi:putative restriction endonuclease
MTDRQKYGDKWQRDETILAFDLYCRIPFRLTKRTNPRVIELAQLIGRTPGSVARKLGNFGSFDPKLADQGISGLTNSSKLDREIWEAFQSDWGSLVLEATEIRATFEGDSSHVNSDEVPDRIPATGTEVVRLRRERVGQQFFRQSVLSSYNSRCCITGINIPECLTASHIVPWSVSQSSRLDPANGFCLSATMDRLFDRFLITIKPDLTLWFCEILKNSANQAVCELCARYHQTSIRSPDRFMPKLEYVLYHNEQFRITESEAIR